MSNFGLAPNGMPFLPLSVAFQQVAPMEERTLPKLFEIVQISFDFDTRKEAEETRQRIRTRFANIQCVGWSKYQDPFPFTSESLIKLTSDIDAMPKQRLGYLYLATLKREAEMLTPKPVLQRLEVNELLVPFIRWRRNANEIEIRMLIVGLFLLFFYALKKNSDSIAVIRYDLIIDAIMRLPEHEIEPQVKRIIQEGVYAKNTYCW